ncbi:NAD(P)-dependent alcohol dehydrogenase [Saccharothrix variisporea]|uniref:NADPH:quinone reductase-like Zn-dependent oxidoreductase n=1 Tax=Saccharothrix variisporea TaxID=543527 RepID=A0A495XBG5_9PSEU|nr:NAD(P)-dependent alcohol dehydrogenase [Saccharothrix variisporea]RKT71337.1 NADPH:quinone reductase-like Zn-dependent oxidoreductase [Saccharothrix variisporea]
MKALVHQRYGPAADVLAIHEVERPEPGDGEVLVRVAAVPVTGTDWHLVRGWPYVARPVLGLRRPRNRVWGLELAGTVTAVGPGVTSFQPGDDVFGWHSGTFAEYAAVPENQLAPQPANLTHVQAAAGPIAAFTALQALRNAPGRRVLISGASGGVGTYAVQIAKAMGKEVTAICGPAKADLVRGLGADRVLDHTKGEFGGGARYDALLDVFGNPSLRDCARVLVDGGTLVLVGGRGGRWLMGTDKWLRAALTTPFRKHKTKVLVHQDRHDDLLTLKDLVEDGKVTPVVGRTYTLDQAPQAIEDVRRGDVRGQAVISLEVPPAPRR